jgi:hypothetical protein
LKSRTDEGEIKNSRRERKRESERRGRFVVDTRENDDNRTAR